MRPQLLDAPRRCAFSMVLATFAALSLGFTAFAQDDFAAPLPKGVNAVWDLDKAYRETTPTRERICINGLWRWQPGLGPDGESRAAATNAVPSSKWGYFKVPGCWPGISDYMQKDSQTLYSHPSWKNERVGNITAVWYERTISLPQDWTGRRINLAVEYLNSYAVVFVDGNKCGEIRFPGGDCDLTAHLRPGNTHVLSLLVIAMPLKAVLLSYTD